MKDIIESLKIRLNNPFIISFLLSWPFWNWQISIGLIWYNSSNLERWTGFKNYYNLIETNSNWWDSVLFPVFSAVVYTFLFPLLKWGISSFNAWISTKEDAQILVISKKGFVPTTKYIEALQRADEEITELSEIIKKEGTLKQENIDLKSELTKTSNELENSKMHIKRIEDLSSTAALEGTWRITLKNIDYKFTADLEINGGLIYSKNQTPHPYFDFIRISGYYANVFQKEVFIGFEMRLVLKEINRSDENLTRFVDDVQNLFKTTKRFSANFEAMIFSFSNDSYTIELKKY